MNRGSPKSNCSAVHQKPPRTAPILAFRHLVPHPIAEFRFIADISSCVVVSRSAAKQRIDGNLHSVFYQRKGLGFGEADFFVAFMFIASILATESRSFIDANTSLSIGGISKVTCALRLIRARMLLADPLLVNDRNRSMVTSITFEALSRPYLYPRDK